MKRYDDILELLKVSDSNLDVVGLAYETARHDEEQLSAARPVIKTILGDLRSVLDYAAMSIFQSYSKKSGSPCFPYGEDEKAFVKAVNKNLNGLEQQLPEVYALVESIQPYACGDAWLMDLCSITNVTKHRHLGIQRRINSPYGSVSVGNIFRVSGNSKISFRDLVVDGIDVTQGKTLVVSDSMSKREVSEMFGGIASVSKSHDWVRFELEDFSGDVLPSLRKAKEKIEGFLDKLGQLVEL